VRTSETQLWIRGFRSSIRDDETNRPLVVCFPHAGGSAGWFRPLAPPLAPVADVVAVQYPGRLDRLAEPPITDLHQLADRIASALRAFAGRPLVLLGHSMGAVVAFETARLLTRAGTPPLRLFASGRRAPDEGGTEISADRGDDWLIQEVRALGGTESVVFDDPDVLDLIMPAIRADFRAISRYRFRAAEPLTCPVTALTGDRDPRVAAVAVRGWERHTTGPFELRVFPGGHFYPVGQWDRIAAAVTADTSLNALP
jgi:surfactin synthase thioesterase subunit